MTTNNDDIDHAADAANATARVHGTVKWFDPTKGFGFVVSDLGGSDILLHANVLRNFGQSSVSDGSKIDIMVQETQRGVQATEVLEIEGPDRDGPVPLEDLLDLDPELLAASELLAARVKWFDKAKGFGFANVFGDPQDVFIHIEVLRQSGLADVQPGEAICIKSIEGKRGRMAISIESWESALKKRD